MSAVSLPSLLFWPLGHFVDHEAEDAILVAIKAPEENLRVRILLPGLVQLAFGPAVVDHAAFYRRPDLQE